MTRAVPFEGKDEQVPSTGMSFATSENGESNSCVWPASVQV